MRTKAEEDEEFSAATTPPLFKTACSQILIADAVYSIKQLHKEGIPRQTRGFSCTVYRLLHVMRVGLCWHQAHMVFLTELP